ADGGRIGFGDVDRDGAADLWHVKETDGGIDVTIWSAASSFTASLSQARIPDVALSPDSRVVTADRDVDGIADLLLVDGRPTGSTVRMVSGADPTRVAETVAGPPIGADEEIGFYDFDGDGRPDLQVLGSDGALHSYLGNTPVTGVAPSTWFLPAGFDCPDDTLPYFHAGLFADDDDSIYQSDIEWLAETGITRGCNPPFQDRFCPDERVSRGQMAAFLVRALGLPAAANRFVDDDGSVFEGDIGALAAAGITRGCNPPANDEFCPDQPVSRGQMAAFLVRALSLRAG